MLILASRSPRRREILERAGIAHRVQPAEVDETPLAGETAREYVLRLARAKADAVDAGPEDILLGADTVVVVGGELLGKPADAEEARSMLRRLSGCEHSVVTGISLRRGRERAEAAEETRVRFVPLTEADIEAYIASGEPMDKAGAYAIQGLASKYIDRIEGCYFNVVGLPVARLWRLLNETFVPFTPLGELR
jgi:septum formation protein